MSNFGWFRFFSAAKWGFDVYFSPSTPAEKTA
jgi:hypothetical protein